MPSGMCLCLSPAMGPSEAGSESLVLQWVKYLGQNVEASWSWGVSVPASLRLHFPYLKWRNDALFVQNHYKIFWRKGFLPYVQHPWVPGDPCSWTSLNHFCNRNWILVPVPPCIFRLHTALVKHVLKLPVVCLFLHAVVAEGAFSPFFTVVGHPQTARSFG